MSDNRYNLISASVLVCLSVIVLALCLCPASSAASEKEFSGNVTIDEDTYLDDGGSVVFANAVVITLDDAVLDLGESSSAVIKGIATIKGHGVLVFGEGTTLSFSHGKFTVPEGGAAVYIDGRLMVEYHYDYVLSTVDLIYVPDGGALRIATAENDQQSVSANELVLNCQYTDDAQAAFDRMVNDPSFGIDDMVRALRVSDSFSMTVDFDSLTYEVREYGGSDYTYRDVAMYSSSEGPEFAFKVTRLGVRVTEFDPDRFVISEGSSTSSLVTGFMIKGVRSPEISVSTDLTFVLSMGAEEMGFFREGDSSAHSVYLSDVALRLETKQFESIFKLFDGSGSVTASASALYVSTSSGSEILVDNVAIRSDFVEGVFYGLDVKGAYHGTEFHVAADGFSASVDIDGDGLLYVNVATSNIAISEEGYTATFTDCTLSVVALDLYGLIVGIVEEKGLTIQMVLDASDHSELGADRLVIDSGHTATMDGVSALLAREGGRNMVGVTFGAFTGRIDTGSDYAEFDLSPTSVRILTDNSLSIVFSALLKEVRPGFSFDADIVLTTEDASASLTSDSSIATHVTGFHLVPDSGTVTLVVTAVYDAPNNVLGFSSDLDLVGTRLDVSGKTAYKYSNLTTSGTIRTHDAVGSIAAELTISDDADTRVDLSASLSSNMDIQISYYGIISKISMTGATVSVDSLLMDIYGFDYREKGVISVFEGAAENDIHAESSQIHIVSSTFSMASETEVITSYSDATIDIANSILDIKREDNLRLAVDNVVISATDSGGEPVSKEIEHFVITKSLASAVEEPSEIYYAVVVILVIAIIAVWAATVYAIKNKRGAVVAVPVPEDGGDDGSGTGKPVPVAEEAAGEPEPEAPTEAVPTDDDVPVEPAAATETVAEEAAVVAEVPSDAVHIEPVRIADVPRSASGNLHDDLVETIRQLETFKEESCGSWAASLGADDSHRSRAIPIDSVVHGWGATAVPAAGAMSQISNVVVARTETAVPVAPAVQAASPVSTAPAPLAVPVAAKEPVEYPAYGRDDFLSEVFLTSEELDKLENLLKVKRNLILQGPPGVGKTYMARRLAYLTIGSKKTENIKAIQFHQSYSYEEFVLAVRAMPDGSISVEEGQFMRFCREAAASGEPYFLIIDEINRGDISKIFGELMMLIEKSHRGETITLMHQNTEFSVPDNVYIIGTMCIADRAVAPLDYALRRRFAFFDVMPNLDRIELDDPRWDYIKDEVKKLNEEIASDRTLGPGFMIGHSYFMEGLELDYVIDNNILPALKNYWHDDPDKVADIARELRRAN